MGKYLGNEAIERAVETYLDHLHDQDVSLSHQPNKEQLIQIAREIGQQVDDLLVQIQDLADGDEEELVLLYSLLKQLPVIVFQPLNYAFVGRVVIPLENVLDLLIHLDVYASGRPVRKSPSPGALEMIDVIESKSTQGIINIAGIGPIYSALLREHADVHTTQDLRERGSTPHGRSELSKATGVSSKLITKWVRRADLMRVDGVGAEYGELVESAGVKSVAELARRNPERLLDKLETTNEEHHLVQRLPSINDVRDWIQRARELG